LNLNVKVTVIYSNRMHTNNRNSTEKNDSRFLHLDSLAYTCDEKSLTCMRKRQPYLETSNVVNTSSKKDTHFACNIS